MRIILLAPQGKETLAIIGGYCKTALESLGHQVEVLDFRSNPYLRSKILSFLRSRLQFILPRLPSKEITSRMREMKDEKINRMLLDLAGRFKPEAVIVLFGENILPQNLKKIKELYGATCIHWMLDTLFVADRGSFLNNVIPLFDRVFIIESLEIAKYISLADTSRLLTLPLACNPEVHKRLVLSEREARVYGSDLAFVGTMIPEREAVLESLADFDLRIWGRWHRRSPLLSRCYQRQDVYGAQAAMIYNASKITLDIHCLFGRKEPIFDVTPRVFEVPACGGFLLTNEVPQLHEFYKVGEEIVTYKDVDDLRRLIEYYLVHPDERAAIAEKGFRRAHKDHTYKQRMGKLIETAKGKQ